MSLKINTPAIILRRWPYSESSMVLHALTPDLGTVSILAKGAYKATSGHMGVLDTWALVNLEASRRPKAELFQLHKAKLIDRMPHLSQTINSLDLAGLFGELAELAAPPEQASEEVFLWLQRSLYDLKDKKNLHWYVLCATLEILELLGLSPAIPEEATASQYWFSPAEGGFITDNSNGQPNSIAKLTPLETIQTFKNAKDKSPIKESDLGNLRICTTMLGDFLHYHLERLPKAWPMCIKSMNKKPL